MSLAGTLAFGTACLAMTSFFNYSPYMAKTSAPASQWADAPIPLVATPQHLTGKVRNSSAWDSFSLQKQILSNVPRL